MPVMLNADIPTGALANAFRHGDCDQFAHGTGRL